MAASQQATTQPSAARVPAKAPLHPQYSATGPPQTPPKKGAALGRGVPPPIPPNKPVIPSKTTPRRADNTETDKKKPTLAGGKELTNAATVGEGRSAPSGIEMLGQELADFQQMFVTMATSNNA